MPPSTRANRYMRLIEAIFLKHYQPGMTALVFERDEINRVAQEQGIVLPKNLGDVLYSFRYRTQLPSSIVEKAPEGFEWIIRPGGRSRYSFVLVSQSTIAPSSVLVETKIPDSTPGVISKYALSDEQALLARVRYNRLLDIFTGITCYSLQNHLRTAVRSLGQVETDEIYVGIDKRGAHYVLPVQAKGHSDKIGIVQIEQDIAVCAAKFPNLICRPIAAQFMEDGTIAMFEFEETTKGLRISAEKHYRLVRPDEVTVEELDAYRGRGF